MTTVTVGDGATVRAYPGFYNGSSNHNISLLNPIPTPGFVTQFTVNAGNCYDGNTGQVGVPMIYCLYRPTSTNNYNVLFCSPVQKFVAGGVHTIPVNCPVLTGDCYGFYVTDGYCDIQYDNGGNYLRCMMSGSSVGTAVGSNVTINTYNVSNIFSVQIQYIQYAVGFGNALTQRANIFSTNNVSHVYTDLSFPASGVVNPLCVEEVGSGTATPTVYRTTTFVAYSLGTVGSNNPFSSLQYVTRNGTVMRNGYAITNYYNRGFCCYAFTESGDLTGTAVFDTDGNASANTSLQNWINSNPSNTIFCIVVLDDAQGNLNSTGIAALQSIGATKISTLAFRGSYALIGAKGITNFPVQESVNNTGATSVTFTQYYVIGSTPQLTASASPTSPAIGATAANLHVRNKDCLGIQFNSGSFVSYDNGTISGSTIVLNGTNTGESTINSTTSYLPSLQAIYVPYVGDDIISRTNLDTASNCWNIFNEPFPKNCTITSVSYYAQATGSTTFAVFRPQTMNITVTSVGSKAGVNNGIAANATFTVNGVSIGPANATRGYNIYVLDQCFHVTTSGVFDVYGNGAAADTAMQQFYYSIPYASLVLVAVCDEGTTNLNSVGANILTLLGGTQFTNLQYQGSYVLIGSKGLNFTPLELVNNGQVATVNTTNTALGMVTQAYSIVGSNTVTATATGSNNVTTNITGVNTGDLPAFFSATGMIPWNDVIGTNQFVQFQNGSATAAPTGPPLYDAFRIYSYQMYYQ